MQKELKQLHDLETFEPLEASSLTKVEKKNAIASLMSLTKKRDGTIKAQACADGRKQQNLHKLGSKTSLQQTVYFLASMR